MLYSKEEINLHASKPLFKAGPFESFVASI
jgi:hypothetical protein